MLLWPNAKKRIAYDNKVGRPLLGLSVVSYLEMLTIKDFGSFPNFRVLCKKIKKKMRRENQH